MEGKERRKERNESEDRQQVMREGSKGGDGERIMGSKEQPGETEKHQGTWVKFPVTPEPSSCSAPTQPQYETRIHLTVSMISCSLRPSLIFTKIHAFLKCYQFVLLKLFPNAELKIIDNFSQEEHCLQGIPNPLELVSSCNYRQSWPSLPSVPASGALVITELTVAFRLNRTFLGTALRAPELSLHIITLPY